VNQDLFDNARWLIGAIAQRLNAGSSETSTLVLERLAAQNLGATAFRAPPPTTLPVLRHLPQCLGEAMLIAPGVAAAIAAIEEDLSWRQSSSYSDALMGEGFLANYAWTEIVGPRGFFPGDDFLLGLLMLGPSQHYRDHFHPAPELYWPLTSGSQWSRNREAFAEQPPGAVIWHPPMTVHASKTIAEPLLAVWCWTSDTMTPARLTEG
jgi:hypothetical protein